MTDRNCELPAVFACGAALTRMPTAGAGNGVRVTRLACAGSVNAGMLLRALEDGADRILVLGCGDGACRHETGTVHALEQVRLVWRLVATLGLDPGRIALELVDRDGNSITVAHRPATTGECE